MLKAPQTTMPAHLEARGAERKPDPEAGYILIAVLFLVALLVISLAVAAPRIAADIQRDKELELVHRGQQYTRAIKLYYKKFGRYPTSMDQLMNTNNLRYLRKRYTDPLTGKDDWKMVFFGQAHIRPMGPFGQALGGATSSAGGSVLGGMPGATGGQSTNPLGTGGSTLGTGGSAFGNSGGSGSSFGNGGSAFGNSGSGNPTDPANPTAGTGTTGSGIGGTGTGQDGNPTGAAGTPGAFGSGTPGGGTNPTLGGGPIVGVVSPVTKASIREYKKQKHYNEWEFVYDPLEDAANGGGVIGGQTNLNGVGNGQNPAGQTTSPFGTPDPTSGGGINPIGSAPVPPTSNPPQ